MEGGDIGFGTDRLLEIFLGIFLVVIGEIDRAQIVIRIRIFRVEAYGTLERSNGLRIILELRIADSDLLKMNSLLDSTAGFQVFDQRRIIILPGEGEICVLGDLAGFDDILRGDGNPDNGRRAAGHQQLQSIKTRKSNRIRRSRGVIRSKSGCGSALHRSCS